MSFQAPVYLLGLLLIPLAVAGYVLMQRRRVRYALRFTNLDLLADVASESPRWRRHVPLGLYLLALLALVLGMARPEATISVQQEQATVALVMDASGSMGAEDVEPTRLIAAKEAARTFLDALPDEYRVGVIQFATEAVITLAPTDDDVAARAAIDAIVAEGGTAMGDSIIRALEMREAEGRSGAGNGEADVPFVILLLSDGENNAGLTQPIDAAQQAASAGVPIFTIALGTPEGVVTLPGPFGDPQIVPVPPDEETLEEIAATTGGEFFTAPTDDELESIYADLGSRLGSAEELREVTHLFAAGGLLALLIGGLLSLLWFNRIP